MLNVVPAGALRTPETEGPQAGRYARNHTTDPQFSLAAHLAKTLAIASVIFGLGIWLARGATWWDWLAIPVFWIVANFFEWGMHRFPMHKPLRPRVLYTNHTLVHHTGFQGDDQEIRSVAELSVVMMPWYTLLMVFALASPIAFVAAFIGDQALAGVFLTAAVAYFLLYEALHTLHHLPQSFLRRIPGHPRHWLQALRRHHHHHHQREHMAHTNFNVTFPLADLLFGTYYATRQRSGADLDDS